MTNNSKEFKNTELHKEVEILVKKLICCYTCCNGVNTVRMSTEMRDALNLTTEESRIIFNTTTDSFEGWNGNEWTTLTN